MKMIIAAVLAATISIAAAEASAQVTFEDPMQFRGTGCRPGSAIVTGEGADMTIKFNAYDAAKPRDKAASNMDNTACSFVVPVQVPPGFQVSTMTADWRGYSEGKVELFREYFFAGRRGPQKTTFPRGNYTESDDLMMPSWSRCGAGKVPIRINSRIAAKGSPSYIKVEKAVRLHLQWRRCR